MRYKTHYESPLGDLLLTADAQALTNYLYQLNEQLTYVLTNLSSENMSEDYLSGKES